MPVVGIPVRHLKRLIGENISNDKIVKTCREIGCDVEELTNINRIKCRQCNNVIEFTQTENLPNQCEICQHEFKKPGTDYEELPQAEVLRLDLLADRPDNFDPGGLARTMRGYLGYETGLPQYEIKSSDYEVFVDPSVQNKNSYRPHIVCAVIKKVSFDDETLKNVMKLQENLHWALGRDRKFASIGVYNLDTIQKKLHYKAMADNEIQFVPLGSPQISKEYLSSPIGILKKHPKGIAYAYLLEGFNKYPILIDDKGTVLSMPPIINSEDTKVTTGTQNIFIDVTGLNPYTINKVLNILITSIKEWDNKCEIYTVKIHYPQEKSPVITPDVAPNRFSVNFDNCRKLIGIDSTDDQIIELLKKMRYDAKKNGNTCELIIPPYRSDIIHEYDIIEDVAIAYGYQNIETKPLDSFTIGNIHPLQKKQQAIREMMIGLGFYEVINIMLTSEKRAYENLNLPVSNECTVIDNPISADQTIVRTELVSGLLETLAHNTNNELPQKIFEIGEVIFLDSRNKETQTREDIVFAAAIVAAKAGFAEIKAVLQSVLHEIDVEWEVDYLTSPLYLEGRACNVIINGIKIGHAGEVHPEILDRLHINNPAVIMELNFSKAGLM